ncbi:TetR/AcrR family transcriptional regulator [Nonomuraea muscovyensis]|uniref:AcrR family transcriptional regulator n=1 Tax=Nonomuraea muscovyensis TaxID=1124761 RepID=A0A7X0CAF4_9ACTN|nr:TetR/AcrR family transcriptional regulator [Nonomuraea muscovyensis]MBB6350475.1 AcrR family transcriptional regulator [Nonomuraea muscovyensis]
MEEQRVLGVATRLFAELGFDGTSVALIAQAAGVDAESVLARIGDKAQLYRQVMLQAHRAEREVVEAAVARFTPSTQGLIELVDAYLDFNLDHPYVLALWMHRWMGDAMDVGGLEELYARPLITMVTGVAGEVLAEDVDADHLTWTVIWCVYGFLTGGMQYTSPGSAIGTGRRPSLPMADSEALRRFRRYLHTLIRRMSAPAA